MAVAVQLDFRGNTLKQYQHVVQDLGYLIGGPSSPGALFHWAAKTDDGLRLVDVGDPRCVRVVCDRECSWRVPKSPRVVEMPTIETFDVYKHLAGG